MKWLRNLPAIALLSLSIPLNSGLPTSTKPPSYRVDHGLSRVEEARKPLSYVYREVDRKKLHAFVFLPTEEKRRLPTAAILLFHGGGYVAASFAGSRAGDQIEINGIAMRWCPPGRFRMGSPLSEPDRRPDEAQVDVTLTQGFWMGQYEVTQGQWKRIVGALPGGVASGEGDDLPVHSVNYAEAEEFCRRLTAQAHASGELPGEWEFHLPTEAQWEYACRAGTTTATAFGDKLSSNQANFAGKPYNGAEGGPAMNRAAQVGRYAPNAWGLHDMHGNAFEWCRDWYHSRLPGGDDPDLSSVKGTMNRDGTYSRVRRGGAWNDDGMYCRSAFRLRYEPERRSDHIGFRVAAVRK